MIDSRFRKGGNVKQRSRLVYQLVDTYIPTDDIKLRPTFVSLDKEAQLFNVLKTAFHKDLTEGTPSISDSVAIIKIFYINAHKLRKRVWYTIYGII